jgi:hypothetical protein
VSGVRAEERGGGVGAIVEVQFGGFVWVRLWLREIATGWVGSIIWRG